MFWYISDCNILYRNILVKNNREIAFVSDSDNMCEIYISVGKNGQF